MKWDGGWGGDVFRGAKNHIISRGMKKGITSIMGSWGHRGRMIWGERSEGQGKSHLRGKWDETEETERSRVVICLWKLARGSWRGVSSVDPEGQ